MTSLLVAIFGLICLSLLLWGLQNAARPYEFSFFAACVMAGWILPEIVGEWNSQYLLPEQPFQMFLLMACLCAGAIAITTFWQSQRDGVVLTRPAVPVYDRKALRVMCIGLCAVGLVFFIRLRMIPWEQLRGGWEGTAVAYFFFSRLVRYAFAIALFLWLDRRDGVLLAIIVCCALAYLDRIVFFGRRGETLRFVLTIMLALYFQRGYRVPRPVLMGGVVLASLLISAVALYRPHVRGQETPDWEAVSQIDLKENFVNVILGESGAEVRKATHLIGAVNRRREFNFGTTYWDNVIREFVPRQLVGTRAKQALTLTRTSPEDMAYQEYGFLGINGAVSMGFSDTYASFWFFGCLVFALLTWLMNRLFRQASEGNLHFQILYTLLIVEALHAITHDTGWAFARALHVFVFVTPCFFIARLVARRNAVARYLAERSHRVGAAIK